MLTEPAQHRLVNALPDAGLHPFMKAAPARHAAAATEFMRQVLPRCSGPEYKEDSRQGCRVIKAPSLTFR